MERIGKKGEGKEEEEEEDVDRSDLHANVVEINCQYLICP